MSTENVSLTFDELRRLVMCVFQAGLTLKGEGLTFSHGNTGNEIIELARRIDNLVADSEKYTKLEIVKADFLREQEAHRLQTLEMLQAWQRFSRELGNILGGQGTPDDYLRMAKEIVAVAEKGKAGAKDSVRGHKIQRRKA